MGIQPRVWVKIIFLFDATCSTCLDLSQNITTKSFTNVLFYQVLIRTSMCFFRSLFLQVTIEFGVIMKTMICYIAGLFVKNLVYILVGFVGHFRFLLLGHLFPAQPCCPHHLPCILVQQLVHLGGNKSMPFQYFS